MRSDAFVAFAANFLGAGSVRSYVSYLDRAERELGLDIDQVDLDEVAIENLKARLLGRGVEPASVRNIGSALACYARFKAAGT